MQRRAAAMYAIFFIALMVGSYAFIAAAQAPHVGIDNPDQRLAKGQSFSVGGTTYTVRNITPAESGGHGGGGGTPATARLVWTDPDATYELEWAPADEVTLENETYVVTIDNESDPMAVVLRHVVEAPTTEVDGETYVVTNDSSGERDLVPIEEYRQNQWGEDATRTFENGSTTQFRGNRTSVAVTETGATLTWNAPMEKEIRLTAGENTSVGPNTYVADVASQGQTHVLVLSTNTKAYAEKVAEKERFQERINGVWGIAILSGMAGVILVGMAYMPVRRT